MFNTTFALQLIRDSGLSLSTLFTTSELAQLPSSVFQTYKNEIIGMQFDRQTARFIFAQLFNITKGSEIKLNAIGNLVIGLDASLLNDVPSLEIKSNFNLFLNSLDDADSNFKETIIRKVLILDLLYL